MTLLRKQAKALYWGMGQVVLVPLLKTWHRSLFPNVSSSLGWLWRYCRWKAQLGELGPNTLMFPGIVIHSPKDVRIGSNCSVGEHVHIWGGGGISIGDDVLIATGTIITSQSHDPDCRPIRASHIAQPIAIDDNVWIGAGAIILPGVSLGRNAIVAAGSVVRESVAAGCVVAGVPARVVRVRTTDGSSSDSGQSP